MPSLAAAEPPQKPAAHAPPVEGPTQPAPAPRSINDPDAEIARRHFERGKELYETGRYEQALAEFEEARRVLPRPAFHFNIARCHDRLEHVQQAIDSYERYLAEDPAVKDAQEVRERITLLRSRLTPGPATAQPAAPPPSATGPPPSAMGPHPSAPAPAGMSSMRKAAIGVGVAAVALGIVGAGLLGSVGPDYRRLREICTLRLCVPSDWGGLQARANAGYAFVGIAGAVAVTDIILWIVDATSKPAARELARLGLGR